MRSRKNRSRPPREDGLLPAAFYGRVSSNLQKVEESIEQQREQCYRWAEQNGYRIVEEFIDQAMSGTREDRPEFNEMVAKALSNGMPFDAIIVWNSARMARNTIYAMVTKKQLDDHGVKFHMLNVPIDEDDEEVAALVYPMIHAMDEVHSIRTGNEVRRAQRARAEKGDWGGSNPPLGYKVQKETKNGRTSRILVIDPEWAWLVKRMYEDYDSGIAVNRLRIQLDSEGIRTPKGKFWANTTITNILKSEVNKGTLVRGLKSNKRKKLDPVRFEEAFDPIVSKELWDRIQQKMADRAPHKPRETVRNHPLTGLLRCAKCGGRMDPDGKRPEKSYYYCINRRKPEPYRCDARGIPMAQAERKAIEGVTSILTPEHMEELIATLESETEEARRQQGQNLERIERHLEKNQHEKSNLLRFVRQNDNIDDSVIASELVDLQRQHKQLVESKICEEIELNKRTRIPNARDQIKAYVGKLRMGISIDDPSKVREVLKTFCDHVTGEKDKHLTIYYNIPLPPEEFGPRERRQQVSLHDPFPSFDLTRERRMTRLDCVEWLQQHDLDVHPKSACVFCPFHKKAEWRQLKQQDGSDWEQEMNVDQAIWKKRDTMDVFIHPSQLPLEEAVRIPEDMGAQQLELDLPCDGACASYNREEKRNARENKIHNRTGPGDPERDGGHIQEAGHRVRCRRGHDLLP